MKLEYVQAGEIVTTHGVRGEMKILPWTDSPDFLCDFDRIRISGVVYEIENSRVQKSCNLLKIRGIDTVEDAQKLRGKTVEVFRCDVSDDLIFAAELIGVEVFSEGKSIGKVTDVLDYPGNKVYVVTGDYEYMIPAVKAFILDLNMEENTMQVCLIEGMGTHEN